MPALTDREIFQISVKVDPGRIGSIEILRNILEGMGIDNTGIVENAQWPDTYLSVFMPSAKKAGTLKARLNRFKWPDVRISVRRLKKEDWKTKWKENFKPFVLTPSFGIVPARLKNKHTFRGREAIYVDTDLAFGTGLHPTTRFMSGFIERYRGKFDSFLDIGTGTGILTIIAAKCGAKELKAVDISRDAVQVARLNFKRNGCPKIELKKQDGADLNTRQKFDFVCANLITQELIVMARKLIGLVKPGKYLAVSGISAVSYPVFCRHYRALPLRCLKIERGEGWTALLYKRSS